MLATTVPRPLCNSTGNFAAVQNAEALLCSLTLFDLPYHSFVFVHVYLPESQLSHIIDHVRILRMRKCAHKPDVHWPYGLDNHIPIGSLLRWIAFAFQ